MGKEKRRERSQWFDAECEAVTEEKNKAYRRTLQGNCTRRMKETYKEKRRIEKRIHRRKKKEWVKANAEQMELLRSQNEARKFFKVVNEAQKPFSCKNRLIKDETGRIISEEKGICESWRRYFNDLLNPKVVPRGSIDVEQEDESNENLEPPKVEEVRIAMKKLKNNKAPGTDNIPAEMLKQGGNQLEQFLLKIVTSVWEEEKMPQQWKEGIICPLYKKGDQMECGNYRGITLLNLGYKVFSNVLFERLLPILQRGMGSYQCGFLPGKSTIDQIFTLRQILEKTTEFGIGTHHLFIDYKAAYDSINREQLYHALREPPEN